MEKKFNTSQLLTFIHKNKIRNPSGTIKKTNHMVFHLFRGWGLTPCNPHGGENSQCMWLMPNNNAEDQNDTCEILMSKSTQRHMITHTLTSHHFYSLNEHACQIPLKVQVTKTIQMPCFFGVLVKQGPFHYHYEWEQCHFCLPAPAKLGENNSGMHKQKQNSYWHTITAHCIPPQII